MTEKKTAQATQGLLTDRELEIETSNLLRKAGIPAHLLGYDYLGEAIKLSYKDKSYIYNVTKRLYPKVAEIYSTTATRAERAMRHAIDLAFERGDIEFINANFSYDPKKRKATNSEFIADAVVYLKNNY